MGTSKLMIRDWSSLRQGSKNFRIMKTMSKWSKPIRRRRSNNTWSLEQSLEKASKRKEDHLAKVVESVKVEDIKIAEAKERREREEKDLQEKARMSLREKLLRAEENQASKNEDMKVKIEENQRKAEAVKLNKSNLVPESA